MMNLSCKKITDSISTLRPLKSDFDMAVSQERAGLPSALETRKKIQETMKEILDQLWPLEILTERNLRQQYDEQIEAYAATGLIEKNSEGQYSFVDAEGQTQMFPTFEQVCDYLKEDEELMTLLKKKEKQGFTRLVVAPFSMDLVRMLTKVAEIVKNQDGGERSAISSKCWQEADLNRKLLYFTQLDLNGKIMGGSTKENLLRDPAFRNQLLNGCLISFCENNQNLVRKNEEVQSINDRDPIKCGRVFSEYFDILNEDQYVGEDIFVLEEWLTLFIQKIYQKYIKKGKKIEDDGTSQILDNDNVSIPIFVRNKFPDGSIPSSCWYGQGSQIFLGEGSLDQSSDEIGIRTAVRKRIEL